MGEVTWEKLVSQRLITVAKLVSQRLITVAKIIEAVDLGCMEAALVTCVATLTPESEPKLYCCL